MASSMEEQSLDLTTCCICLEYYDLKEHKPKYLPCSHTFCFGCLKGINRDAVNCVTCPVCKTKLSLPVAAVEGLPNNLGVIHIIKLENEKKAGQSWCLTCEALVKPTCEEAHHKTHSLLEEAEESQTELDDVLNGYKEGDGMRGRVDGVLQTMWKAIEAQIAENNNGRQKMQAAIVICQEMAKLSPGMKTSAVIRKKIEQMKKEMKDELEQAKNFLNRVAPEHGPAEQLLSDQSVAGRSAKMTAEAAAGEEDGNGSPVAVNGQNRRHADSRGAFSAKCFSVHRKESNVTSSFHCKDLIGGKDGIIAVEFSDDGSLLASGGSDNIVRLWPISQNLVASIQMETRHNSTVYSFAFAPDNRRLFSGGLDGEIFIHDIQTKKLLNTVASPTMKSVVSISLKPASDGNVFASADYNGILRIFDIRRSTSIPVFEDKNMTGDLLCSVMFSPVNSSLIAVAGFNGTRIMDIRNIGANRFVQSFDSTVSFSARFDGKGNRLLCEPNGYLPVVYNVRTDQQQPAANEVTDKVQLTAPGYSDIGGISTNCFAGVDDELVVASSSDRNLYIWSVPEGVGDRTIDQSLLSLTGHQHAVNAVRYCKATSTLASGDDGGVIELWTPSISSP